MEIPIVENFLKLYLPLFIVLVGSILSAFALHYFLYYLLNKRFSKKSDSFLYTFFKKMHGPLVLIFPLLLISIATSILDFDRVANAVGLLVKLLTISAIGWSLIELIDYSDNWVINRNRENFNRIAVKFYLLKKIAKIIIIFLAIAFFLVNFESVKELGRGLLLSATVAGGIILFAAQGIFGNIISGFQLTFTRPLNIGDDLTVNGEFGTVEEVTLTNVVVKLWDSRRLIVPSSYFMDKPYENWSYPSQDLLGTVFLYTDYNVEVERIREELQRVLATTSLWDDRVGKLEVTDLTERNMQLRVLVSARNSNDIWQLRCYVREALVDFLYKHCHQSLPKMYAAIDVNSQVNDGDKL